MSEHVRTDRDGAVGTVTIDRPEKLNALSTAINMALREAFDAFANEDVAAVVLRSAGDRAFVAGADLTEIRGMSNREFVDFQRTARETNDAIAAHPTVVVAAVDGIAYGGGFELALAADLVVADRGAEFALPEVGLGLVPGGGATQRLPRVVGTSKAKELLTTGEPVDATAARDLGLVDRLVDDADDGAQDLAGTIADNAPLAVRAAKRLVDEGRDVPLDAGLSYEQEVTFRLFDTDDAREGIEAFLEDRDPEFRGR